MKKWHEPLAIYRAWIDTPHYTFEAIDTDEQQAIESCYSGWLAHCSVNEMADPDYVKRADISVSRLVCGEYYRDGIAL